MKREDFLNVVYDKIHDDGSGKDTAADICYELAKQMAIEFAVYNGMLPEVADYHFKEFETQSNEK